MLALVVVLVLVLENGWANEREDEQEAYSPFREYALSPSSGGSPNA